MDSLNMISCILAHDYAAANRMKIPIHGSRVKVLENESIMISWGIPVNSAWGHKPFSDCRFQHIQCITYVKNMSGIQKEHKFTPDKIYSLDEIANKNAHTLDKVVACKGIKQVGTIISDEKCPNKTSVICINALGLYPTNIYIPPCSF
jgi:hypothetical protein